MKLRQVLPAMLLAMLWATVDAARAAVLPRTAKVGEPVFFQNPADATWQVPQLPDGTLERTYFGKSFGWAFTAPGTYTIRVTPGNDYAVTVEASPASRVTTVGDSAALAAAIRAAGVDEEIRLRPGAYRLGRTTLNRAGLRIVADDDASWPTVTFPAGGYNGFVVTAPRVQLRNLAVTDGQATNQKQKTFAVEVAAGGSAYVDGLRVRDIDFGLHMQTPQVLGLVARHVTTGPNVRSYPFATSAGRNAVLTDFDFSRYDGREHPVRVNGNVVAGKHVPSRDVLVAFGTCDRKTAAKEPLTIRHGERVSVHNVTMRGGYAVRLCWDFRTGPDQPDVLSRDVSFRLCEFDGVPLSVYASGVDGLLLVGNTFTGKQPPISYTAVGGRLRNVTQRGNVWAGRSGEKLHRVNGGGAIAGHVVED